MHEPCCITGADSCSLLLRAAEESEERLLSFFVSSLDLFALLSTPSIVLPFVTSRNRHPPRFFCFFFISQKSHAEVWCELRGVDRSLTRTARQNARLQMRRGGRGFPQVGRLLINERFIIASHRFDRSENCANARARRNGMPRSGGRRRKNLRPRT